MREIGVKFGYSGSNGSNSWGSNWSNAVTNHNTYQDNQRARYDATQANLAAAAQDVAGGGYTARVLPTLANFAMDPNISLPVSAASSSIALVHSLASGALGLELSAMQEQNKGKILSNPRVLTQDRKEAVIESGQEIPYEESSSSGATSITFKKAVFRLHVTPIFS